MKVPDTAFNISEIFDDVSKNFVSMDKSQLLKLPKKILFEIITNKNLLVSSEDDLFDFIIELFDKSEDKNNEIGLIDF